jgi:hypothetical protein
VPTYEETGAYAREGDSTDAVLSEARQRFLTWYESDPHSEEEWQAGRDLAWAFRLIDARLSAGGDLPAEWDVSAEVPYEAGARRLLSEGKRIEAIKYVRNVTGWDLRRSKDYVDRLIESA